MATKGVLSCDRTGKNYLHAGFTTTIDASFNGAGGNPTGATAQEASYVDIDTSDDKAHRYKGFSSTLLDCFTNPIVTPKGIDWDGKLLFTGDQSVNDKIYRHIGFTSSINDSLNTQSIDGTLAGVAWDGSDTLFNGATNDRIYKLTGFTTSVSSSYAIADSDSSGVAWDGSNVLQTDDIVDIIIKYI